MNHLEDVIFIGLPGLTHHYGGLSADNVASATNRGSMSSPKEAALQVLGLIRLLKGLGVRVAVLPPQLRPHMPLLRQHFQGEDAEVIRQASMYAQHLLEKASSASAMWVANAATVSPSTDTLDKKLHITAANLFTNVHRRIEAEDTHAALAAVFADVPDVEVHAPLSAMAGLLDEGAANHMRFAPVSARHGLHVFVYGTDGSMRDPETARQSLSASRAIAAQHQLPQEQVLFIRQNAQVIREGVFHNDVIAVSHGNVLLAHEEAFERGSAAVDVIGEAYQRLFGEALIPLIIEAEDLTVEEAVQCYFFNSQIVTMPSGGMAIVAPVEVEQLFDGKALALMERLVADPGNPIEAVHVVDLRQSMRNGGGPACLRLRVPMTGEQIAALQSSVRVVADEGLLEDLEGIIEAHYPESLHAQDLGNPEIYKASREALEAFGVVMGIPLLADQ